MIEAPTSLYLHGNKYFCIVLVPPGNDCKATAAAEMPRNLTSKATTFRVLSAVTPSYSVHIHSRYTKVAKTRGCAGLVK